MTHQHHRASPGPWHPLALASLLCLTAFQAQAAEPAAGTAGPNGLMRFEHARVETLSPAAAKHLQAEAAAASQPAMRAFRDPDTGRLVQPSAEQAAALQAAAPRSLQLRRSDAPRTIYLPQGGVGIALDASMDSHSVASKTPDGRVDTACLPDEASAQSALKAGHHGAVGHVHRHGKPAAGRGELQ